MINSKAYTEVYYLINEMSKYSKSKIPNKILKEIYDNSDKEYIPYFDDLGNIALSNDAEKLLSVIYTDYFSTPEEKIVIKAKERICNKNKGEIYA